MDHESILRATNFRLEEKLILNMINGIILFFNNIAYHLV